MVKSNCLFSPTLKIGIKLSPVDWFYYFLNFMYISKKFPTIAIKENNNNFKLELIVMINQWGN